MGFLVALICLSSVRLKRKEIGVVVDFLCRGNPAVVVNLLSVQQFS